MAYAWLYRNDVIQRIMLDMIEISTIKGHYYKANDKAIDK